MEEEGEERLPSFAEVEFFLFFRIYCLLPLINLDREENYENERQKKEKEGILRKNCLYILVNLNYAFERSFS